MNVLSLFDGMSCGRVALERAGIPVTNYYASEIDKYAIQVSQKNYPDIIRLGDVTKWREWDLPAIDLVLAGSPCQGFSLAGKQLAFDDPRSKLFFEFVEIVKHYRPPYFLLENVKMKKENLDVITEITGCEPAHINSNLVSAQNRDRYYWFNWDDPVIEDKGILLRDILIEAEPFTDKAYCLRARGADSPNPTDVKRFFDKSLGNYVLDNLKVPEDKVVAVENDKPGGVVGLLNGKDSQATRVRNIDGKASTLLGSQGGLGKMMGMYDLTPLYLSDKAKDYMDRDRQPGKPRWEYHTNPVDGKAACLTANMHKGVPYGVIRKYMRRLHPVECERLQTLPDNYTEGVSATQRYTMLGNGWTVDVIVEILNKLKEVL